MGAASSTSGLDAAMPPQVDELQFRRYFELMGVQRHLKAAGIFARLNHRDGKPATSPIFREHCPISSNWADDYPELRVSRSADRAARVAALWRHSMRAMILAAGRGERLRPLTDTVPKASSRCMARACSSVISQHLHNAGIRTVVINLGWLGEKIVERVGSGSALRAGCDLQPRRATTSLKPGGGIHKALPILGSAPFLVVNADVYTDMPVPRRRLADDVTSGTWSWCQRPAYRDHGDFDLDAGLVRNSDRAALTFSGVAIYRPEFFAGCEAGRFPLAPMLREAADAGRLSGSLYEGSGPTSARRQRLAGL